MKASLLLLAAFALAAPAVRADDILTPTQIAAMQQRGWINPGFEAASRQLIDANEAGKKAKDDEALLEAELPALQKNAAAEDAKVVALQADLARYDHPDETDFIALQAAMKNTSAKPGEQLAQAQAYVWTYPASPHLGEAEGDLQQLEKKIADQVQSAKDADAARQAAQLKLLARVKAHDLSLGEWSAFLQDKSQDEVRQYLGDPTSEADGYWIYGGNWTVDPASNLAAGLQLTFNGGRVQNVAPAPGK
jgi:hypothetical protein